MNQVPPTTLNQTTDDELMELAQKGHRASFAAIFDRHGLSVLRYARMLTGSLADAQDLTQEVFLKAYAQRMAYRKMGIMKHWLFTICRHLHIDQQRRRIVRPIPTDPQELSDQVMTQPETCFQELKEHLKWLMMCVLEFTENCCHLRFSARYFPVAVLLAIR